MAEHQGSGYLLRSIPYSESSLIVHVLTAEHGKVVLMARGARRAKSPFRPALAPLFELDLRWRSGRTGMGTLIDVQRGRLLIPESCHIEGLELLALAGILYHEGLSHGYESLGQTMYRLQQRSDRAGLCAAKWLMLKDAGWLGDMSHCWQCGADGSTLAMVWHQGHLLCRSCGSGVPVSPGLRKVIDLAQSGENFINIRMNDLDISCWELMIRDVVRSCQTK
ncbi:MAG: hypothetical protein AUJ56_10975 [Zetaproteobacteria bacterium CG1_02_49_23]|nr:MAG: hypothetical protein AUJ56_10975 [Zetaproteobacteria bacterium CG1_02_49_23]